MQIDDNDGRPDINLTYKTVVKSKSRKTALEKSLLST
jgi:hypothetical protein